MSFNLLSKLRIKRDIQFITSHVNAQWYIEKYRQLKIKSPYAAQHYFLHGWKEGLDPSPQFSTISYLQLNQDVAHSGVNPLLHYLRHGRDEGRKALSHEEFYQKELDFLAAEVRPYIDDGWYKAQLSNANLEAIDPAIHYLTKGWRESLDPSPNFSTKFYLGAYADVAASPMNPLVHFVRHGVNEGRIGIPLDELSKRHTKLMVEEIAEFVDTDWYVNQSNLDLEGMDAPTHYFEKGWKQGLDPSRHFSGDLYLTLHNDVRSAQVNPLYHYIKWGKSENRAIDYRSFNTTSVSTNKYQIRHKDIEAFNLFTLDVPRATDDKVVTFDIWDTVLRRNSDPEDVKLAVSYYFLNIAFDNLKELYKSKDSLYKLRLECERQVVQTTDYEYKFANMIPLWIKHAVSPKAGREFCENLEKKLVDFELEFEKYNTFLDPVIERYIKELDKPIYFISDFYHSKEFVCKILEHHRILKYFVDGYVSSDYLQTKRSGGLFSLFLEHNGLLATDVLHIGDNEHSDVLIPSEKFLIKTHHYLNHHVQDRSKQFKSMFDEKLYGGCLSKTYDGAIDHLGGESLLRGDLFQNGRVFSLAVYGYCLRILEECIRTRTQKIYFFAREGLFLKQVFDQVAQQSIFRGQTIESHVLSVSRIATLLPSISKPCRSEWMRIWNQYSTQSPKAFCSTLSLPEDLFRKTFESYGVDFDEPVQYPWKSEELMAVLDGAEFQTQFVFYRDKARSNIIQYLEDMGFYESDFNIVVDVGWRGTIQDNISLLTGCYTRGFYLGLLSYLNNQPSNSDKVGWLFNVNTGDKQPGFDFAPIEMLCNGLGGSVVGYEKGEAIRPIHQIIDDEERVVSRVCQSFQAGVLNGLPSAIEYCQWNSLSSDDIAPLAEAILVSMLNNPSAELADLFGELTHNETFGMGTVENFSHSGMQNSKDFSDISNSEVHDDFYRQIVSSRWKEAVTHSGKSYERVQELTIDQRFHLPSEFFFPFYKINGSGVKIGFYVPRPLVGSGGHRTIFNLARKFYSMGYSLFIFLESSDEHSVGIVQQYLADATAVIYTEWLRHIKLDIAVATIAHSANFVGELKSPKTKAYLIQDFEAFFNPMGDAFHIAEQSYINGLLNCTVGNWLGHVLKSQFREKSISSGLGVDTSVYFPIDGCEKERAICFLFQPEKPRRCPDLAIGALRILKNKYPDLKIYLYGSNAEFNLDFEVINLGLIHDLSAINELYNKCMAGLCLSLTNPSRIPFEVMASGAVPVDLFRYNNLFDYEDGTIVLAYQSEICLANSIEQIIYGSDYETRRNSCIEFARSRSLDWEMSAFVNAISYNHFISEHLPEINAKTYNEYPDIPAGPRLNQIKAFLDYQVFLANRQ